jgi:hypothetical protein
LIWPEGAAQQKWMGRGAWSTPFWVLISLKNGCAQLKPTIIIIYKVLYIQHVAETNVSAKKSLPQKETFLISSCCSSSCFIFILVILSAHAHVSFWFLYIALFNGPLMIIR